MAAFDDDRPFRFMDLPRELRNKVYSLLLCSFETRPWSSDSKTGPFKVLLPIVKVKHSVDTAILLTNSQIHREAYDVMIKTNRFVLITSTNELPLEPVLRCQGTPVVTTDAKKAISFRGYVLELTLSAKKKLVTELNDLPDYSIQPMSAMILARDLITFCISMTMADGHCSNFSMSVFLDLHVAPLLDWVNPRYQDKTTAFFSELTQKALLDPFQAYIRDFTDIKVRGHVLPKLAKATEDKMREPEWIDPAKAMVFWKSIKETARLSFQRGDYSRAYHLWTSALNDAMRIRSRKSWSSLVAQANNFFIKDVDELMFTSCLNAIHAVLTCSSLQKNLGPFVTYLLEIAKCLIQSNYWGEGYTYKPSDSLLAKLRYREAVVLRLSQNPLNIPAALFAINQALLLLPDDPKIKEEARRFDAWAGTFSFQS